jgi:PAS domain S-box-containing protein
VGIQPHYYGLGSSQSKQKMILAETNTIDTDLVSKGKLLASVQNWGRDLASLRRTVLVGVLFGFILQTDAILAATWTKSMTAYELSSQNSSTPVQAPVFRDPTVAIGRGLSPNATVSWAGAGFSVFAGSMAALMAAGLAWVSSLRRQVRRQTATIQKEKNLLATLIDHLPDNVYIKDLEGRYMLTNQAHARFHGAPSPEHFRNKAGSDFFPPAVARALAEADAKVLRGQVSVLDYEEEVVNGQGLVRLLATTKVPLKDSLGRIQGLVGFSRDVTETRRAENELREKQRSLATLMSNLPGLAYRCRNDKTWAMEFLSEGCSDLTGYAPADLVDNAKKSYAQLVHPDDRERIWNEIQRALAQKQKFQLLYRIIPRDGPEKWVWEQGLGVFSADGVLEALEGFIIDITERRRADEALRVSEERFRAIWEHSIDGMRLTDHQGIIIAVNEAFCQLVKLPREKLVGHTFAVVQGVGSGANLEAYLERFRSGRIVPRTTERMQFWNREERDVEVSSCFINLGHQERAVLSILRDVSERRRVESILDYERDLLTALFDNLPDALYFKDLQSRFVRVSKSKLESSWTMARRRYEATVNQARHQEPASVPDATAEETLPAHLVSRDAFAEYIIGKSDFDFFDAGRARSAFDDEQEIVRTGNPLIGKVEQTHNLDGWVKWSLTTKMPWRDKDGRIIGTFGVSKDITAIKEAEASVDLVHKQLLEASRQAGMAEVATGVLHNVGNVLNSVNVSTTLLSEKLQQSRAANLSKVVALLREHSAHLDIFMAQDPRGRQLPLYLEQLAGRLAAEQTSLLAEVRCLAKNIDHIKSIVAMQQTYARPSGFVESVQPVELIEDALRINGALLARQEVQIIREYEPQLPKITIDKHKVLQILVNLISNAGHSCAQSQSNEKRVTVRLKNGAQRLTISISDNGVGIAPENLTRIFNLGFTTRPDGHGFGLHSGALAAREMGGTLTTRSDGPGRGASFTLELPTPPCAS